MHLELINNSFTALQSVSYSFLEIIWDEKQVFLTAKYDRKLYLYMLELSILVKIREVSQDPRRTVEGTLLNSFS